MTMKKPEVFNPPADLSGAELQLWIAAQIGAGTIANCYCKIDERGKIAWEVAGQILAQYRKACALNA